jgi:hypothetical protein
MFHPFAKTRYVTKDLEYDFIKLEIVVQFEITVQTRLCNTAKLTQHQAETGLRIGELQGDFVYELLE